MRYGRKLYIFLMTAVIAVISACFIVLDFSRFINYDYSYDIYPSAVLKRICVVIAASIAWSVGRDGLNPTDSRQMKAAFLFAVVGEAAFALGDRVLGVGMFGMCHLLLLIRNSTGLRYKIIQAGGRKKLVLAAMLLLMAFMVCMLIGHLGSLAGDIALSVSVIGYSVILTTSLWAATACFTLKLLPPINSRLSAAGVLCFFCCDVLVGLDAVLEPGIPWLLANSLIWVCYIPALTLLALSTFKY